MILALEWFLWEDIWYNFFTPILMTGSLVAWILSGRRWNSYAYWFVVALGLIHYGGVVISEGWKEVLPHYPFHYTHTFEGQTATVTATIGCDSRWRMHFAARVLDWTIVLLSLSAPFWRKWLRRNLGLRDHQGVSGEKGDMLLFG